MGKKNTMQPTLNYAKIAEPATATAKSKMPRFFTGGAGTKEMELLSKYGTTQ